MKYQIILPNGEKYIMYYTKEHGYYERIELVNDLLNTIIDSNNEEWNVKLIEYLESHWIWLNAFNSFKYNYEDKNKSLLDRLTAFIYAGLEYEERKDHKTLRDIVRVHKKELPVSCCPENVQKIFADDGNEMGFKFQFSEGIMKKEFSEMTPREIDVEKNKVRKTTKKKTRFDKYEKLFSKDDRIVPYLTTLTNREYYEEQGLNPIEFMTLEDFKNKMNKPIEEVVQAWLNKTKSNIYNQPILVIKRKTIKGHKGIIDPHRPYKKSWCYVYTDNTFKYEGEKYIISQEVKQYKVDKDNQAEMDSIFILEQDGERYYFDQNIDKVKNKYINKY